MPHPELRAGGSDCFPAQGLPALQHAEQPKHVPCCSRARPWCWWAAMTRSPRLDASASFRAKGKLSVWAAYTTTLHPTQASAWADISLSSVWGEGEAICLGCLHHSLGLSTMHEHCLQLCWSWRDALSWCTGPAFVLMTLTGARTRPGTEVIRLYCKAHLSVRPCESRRVQPCWGPRVSAHTKATCRQTCHQCVCLACCWQFALVQHGNGAGMLQSSLESSCNVAKPGIGSLDGHPTHLLSSTLQQSTAHAAMPLIATGHSQIRDCLFQGYEASIAWGHVRAHAPGPCL